MLNAAHLLLLDIVTSQHNPGAHAHIFPHLARS